MKLKTKKISHCLLCKNKNIKTGIKASLNLLYLFKLN